MSIKTIEIRDGKRTTFKIRKKLKRNGFTFIKTGKYNGYWKKNTSSAKQIRYWKKYSHIGYECRVYDAKLHERNTDYRRDYFEKNYPDVINRFHCAYCGKLLPREELVVDHLIPVQKAKSSTFWQIILKITGIKNVNNIRNLVGACQRCNTKKGAKTSVWILRGIIGRHYSVWLSVKTTVVMVLLIVLSIMVS